MSIQAHERAHIPANTQTYTPPHAPQPAHTYAYIEAMVCDLTNEVRLKLQPPVNH